MSEVPSEWISLPNVLLQVPRALQHQSAHHVRGLEQHQAAPVSVCSNVHIRMQTGRDHSNICTRGAPSSPSWCLDVPFWSNHHFHLCHPVVRLFPSPGDSGAPSLPPLTSRRMRESLTRFPRWDKGFTSSSSSSSSWTNDSAFDGSSS